MVVVWLVRLTPKGFIYVPTFSDKNVVMFWKIDLFYRFQLRLINEATQIK